MASPEARRNIARIIPFGVIWLIFSLVYTILEKGILGGLNYYPSTGNPYNFNWNIWVTTILALITGIGMGAIEILYLSKVFIQKSFVQKILYKSLIYFVIILFFLLILSAIGSYILLGTGISNPRLWKNMATFFFSYSFSSIGLYMASIIVVTQFYNEVSENIGQAVLNNFLTGKYHKPREEERIFMFLDMKASTTIAESIGHVQYFEMLREYYSDLSGSIIKYWGEIYQYVGDEVVVSWKLKAGLPNNNCVQCFFAMKAAIKNQAQKYQQKFGLLPDFKAGLHLGKVTTGEIGALKKEIIFTGDVLNATARIQGLCNQLNLDILISGQLKEKLDLPAPFEVIALGENELRGRDEKIKLFTVRSLSVSGHKQENL